MHARYARSKLDPAAHAAARHFVTGAIVAAIALFVSGIRASRISWLVRSNIGNPRAATLIFRQIEDTQSERVYLGRNWAPRTDRPQPALDSFDTGRQKTVVFHAHSPSLSNAGSGSIAILDERLRLMSVLNWPHLFILPAIEMEMARSMS